MIMTPNQSLEIAGKATSLKSLLQIFNTLEKGSYKIRAKQDREYNEIQIVLKDGRSTVATAFIDLGHEPATRKAAMKEALSTVRIYLREPIEG
jgi:hypothetical protein